MNEQQQKDPCGGCKRHLMVEGLYGNDAWFCSFICAIKKAKDEGYSSSFIIRKNLSSR